MQIKHRTHTHTGHRTQDSVSGANGRSAADSKRNIGLRGNDERIGSEIILRIADVTEKSTFGKRQNKMLLFLLVTHFFRNSRKPGKREIEYLKPFNPSCPLF